MPDHRPGQTPNLHEDDMYQALREQQRDDDADRLDEIVERLMHDCCEPDMVSEMMYDWELLIPELERIIKLIAEAHILYWSHPGARSRHMAMLGEQLVTLLQESLRPVAAKELSEEHKA